MRDQHKRNRTRKTSSNHGGSSNRAVGRQDGRVIRDEKRHRHTSTDQYSSKGKVRASGTNRFPVHNTNNHLQPSSNLQLTQNHLHQHSSSHQQITSNFQHASNDHSHSSNHQLYSSNHQQYSSNHQQHSSNDQQHSSKDQQHSSQHHSHSSDRQQHSTTHQLPTSNRQLPSTHRKLSTHENTHQITLENQNHMTRPISSKNPVENVNQFQGDQEQKYEINQNYGNNVNSVNTIYTPSRYNHEELHNHSYRNHLPQFEKVSSTNIRNSNGNKVVRSESGEIKERRISDNPRNGSILKQPSLPHTEHNLLPTNLRNHNNVTKHENANYSEKTMTIKDGLDSEDRFKKVLPINNIQNNTYYNTEDNSMNRYESSHRKNPREESNLTPENNKTFSQENSVFMLPNPSTQLNQNNRSDFPITISGENNERRPGNESDVYTNQEERNDNDNNFVNNKEHEINGNNDLVTPHYAVIRKLPQPNSNVRNMVYNDNLPTGHQKKISRDDKEYLYTKSELKPSHMLESHGNQQETFNTLDLKHILFHPNYSNDIYERTNLRKSNSESDLLTRGNTVAKNSPRKTSDSIVKQYTGSHKLRDEELEVLRERNQTPNDPSNEPSYESISEKNDFKEQLKALNFNPYANKTATPYKDENRSRNSENTDPNASEPENYDNGRYKNEEQTGKKLWPTERNETNNGRYESRKHEGAGYYSGEHRSGESQRDEHQSGKSQSGERQSLEHQNGEYRSVGDQSRKQQSEEHQGEKRFSIAKTNNLEGNDKDKKKEQEFESKENSENIQSKGRKHTINADEVDSISQNNQSSEQDETNKTKNKEKKEKKRSSVLPYLLDEEEEEEKESLDGTFDISIIEPTKPDESTKHSTVKADKPDGSRKNSTNSPRKSNTKTCEADPSSPCKFGRVLSRRRKETIDEFLGRFYKRTIYITPTFASSLLDSPFIEISLDKFFQLDNPQNAFISRSFENTNECPTELEFIENKNLKCPQSAFTVQLYCDICGKFMKDECNCSSRISIDK